MGLGTLSLTPRVARSWARRCIFKVVVSGCAQEAGLGACADADCPQDWGVNEPGGPATPYGGADCIGICGGFTTEIGCHQPPELLPPPAAGGGPGGGGGGGDELWAAPIWIEMLIPPPPTPGRHGVPAEGG